MLHTRMTTLALELPPLHVFEFDFVLLCNSSTLHNILMILGRNGEHEETTCCLQE